MHGMLPCIRNNKVITLSKTLRECSLGQHEHSKATSKEYDVLHRDHA